MLSGLLHHLQRREQALRKTVVRIPGPSCVQKCWMFSTLPFRDVGLAIRASIALVSKSDAERPRDLHEHAVRWHGTHFVDGFGERHKFQDGRLERHHYTGLIFMDGTHCCCAVAETKLAVYGCGGTS